MPYQSLSVLGMFTPPLKEELLKVLLGPRVVLQNVAGQNLSNTHSVIDNIIGTSEAVSMKEYLAHTGIDDILAPEAFVEATLNCRSKLQHDLYRKICVALDDAERNELEQYKQNVDNLLKRSLEFLKSC